MTTARRYRITNPTSGLDLGIYEGATEAEALDAFARSAGYASYPASAAALDQTVEEMRAEITVEDVTDAPRLTSDATYDEDYAEARQALDAQVTGEYPEGERAKAIGDTLNDTWVEGITVDAWVAQAAAQLGA